MKLSLLLSLTIVGSACAFQPSSNKAPSIKKSTSRTQEVKPLQIAISSPFRNVFNSVETPQPMISKIDYVVERDYSVALTLLLVGVWLSLFHPSDSMFIDMLGAAFHIWFGCFIGMQTMRTRAVFNKDTFELKTVTNKVLGLERDKGLKAKEYKNYVLGTNNEWRYDSFVNYDFFPSIQLPILVYFKETQTPKEMQIKGSLGMKQMDRRDNGQMHWFPAFANARQLKEQFEAHRCKKIGTVNGEEFKK